MKELTTEVVIAGAGLTGSTLAHLLSRNGIECLIVDPGNFDRNGVAVPYDPRAISITPASAKIFSSINIWQKLPENKIGKFDQIHVWDETSAGEICFDCAEICEPVLGYIIEQNILQNALIEAIPYSSNITLLNECRVSSITRDNDNTLIELNNGDKINANLLVAADGVNSSVRSLAGLELNRHEYDQLAVACIVKTELGHKKIARQRFLDGGPLAFLPMAEPNTCGVVWSTNSEHAEFLMDLSDERFGNELHTAIQTRMGKIIHSEPRVSFKLFRANADQYISEKCVLVGDAAHNIHPMAGMGANMGILDVAILSELMLAARKRNKNFTSRRVLRNYERWRKGENGQMIMILEVIKYLFDTENEVFKYIRSTGLNAINDMPIIKNQIMRYAMGLAGDMPTLVRQSLIQGTSDVRR